MKKIQVRSRDIERELTQYAISITKKDHVELLEDAFRVLLINHEPAFFEYHDTWVPALKSLSLAERISCARGWWLSMKELLRMIL